MCQALTETSILLKSQVLSSTQSYDIRTIIIDFIIVKAIGYHLSKVRKSVFTHGTNIVM